MSMGSIDAVTMAPRTLNAADAQGRELNQNQHIYDQNGIQFQQEVRRESRQTVERITIRKETEKGQVRKIPQKRNKNRKKRND